MLSAEVRRVFLDYFQQRGHAILPSSPVIPQGDKTLLFTNAGMVQFKDVFTGRQTARQPRAATVQKCIRAGGKHNDLDNVGFTTRHLTFFEMLGNFSFGDYFKREAIAYAWELVTRGFGLEPSRLWVTVYREDDEARRLWKEISGLADERIVGMGEKDNYWSMGDVGPCGPCSEVLLDRGEAYGEADVENGERFFEIWNLVFMQFNQAADGTKTPLPRPSIDTGMGLERLAMVLQGANTVFETDVLGALIRQVEDITGVAYDPGPRGVPHRVLADHVRSLVFAIADGEVPSNEGRGYVLRRILRRAARYGRKIHRAGPILCLLVETVCQHLGDAYPEIKEHQESIVRHIRSEEEAFGRTLDRGIELFDGVVAGLRKAGEKVVPGEEIFVLKDRYGFPEDLVERMALDIGFEADMEGYRRLMKEKQEETTYASDFEILSPSESLDGVPETAFLGYSETRAEAEVQLVREREGLWQVVLSQTPFYGESGGQVGDRGVIDGEGFRLEVEDTQKERGRTLHVARLAKGAPESVAPGAVVQAVVDEERRRATERNHSATHLLHAALRQVLGTHVRQKGSLVEPQRLRFDVTHFSGISAEELERVEDLVHQQVLQDVRVETEEMDYQAAIQQGALAFFGEKYDERVRVVRMGDFSTELCGGTHVDRTGSVGPFAIIHEGSVSAGVRRLEALTAVQVQNIYRENARLVESLARSLKVTPDRLLDRVERLLQENRELKSQRGRVAPSGLPEGQIERRKIGDILFARGLYEGVGGKELLASYDRLKTECRRLIVALASVRNGKVQLLVAVTPPLTQEGWDARDIFRCGADFVKARGGGRPEMVQAGGSAPEAALQALEAMEERVLRGL